VTEARHHRRCETIALCSFLLLPALWLTGVPFEGRHNSTFAHVSGVASDIYDWALLGVAPADLAFLVWFVWYAAGLRWRMLAFAAVQFSACCFVVYADCLWAGGPP
jgi:hypothetical protein